MYQGMMSPEQMPHGACANENVAVADRGPGAFLDPDVAEIVKSSYLHRATTMLEWHHATA
jgi:hypothetical protein